MSTGYIFGPKFNSGQGSGVGEYYRIGRVKSIVLGPTLPNGKADPNYKNPTSVGSIYYELLYSALSTSKSKKVSEPAFPMWNFVKQLPLINEIVIIFPGPTFKLNDSAANQKYYYMPAFALWDNPNHNGFPNLEEWADFLNKSTNKPQYSGNSTATKLLPLGYTFKENPNIKDLQPFEGDTIIQARFGQSIRFGSTVSVMKQFNTWSNNSKDKNGDPITIITNRQGERVVRNKFDPIVEDINKDGSSIYLTSTQPIDIKDLYDFPLESFKTYVGDTSAIDVINIPKKPISNQFTSAADQDKKSNA